MRDLILGLAVAFMLAVQSLHAAVVEFNPNDTFADVKPSQSESDRARLDDLLAKAEKGEVLAQYALMSVFEDGLLGIKKDPMEALKWLRKAAEQNYSVAQFWLGFAYSTQSLLFSRTPGHPLYRSPGYPLLLTGDPLQPGSLGIWIEQGAGQAKSEGGVDNKVEAVKWYRKAAEQNFGKAQYSLGSCYIDGVGVAKDEVKAVKWYRKAADEGNAYAQNLLGLCYKQGNGVAQDSVEAARWYRKSAEQGNSEALINLEAYYERGDGLTNNSAEAQYYRRETQRRSYESMAKSDMFTPRVPEAETVEKSWVVDSKTSTGIAQTRPKSSGTGFFITEDGYLITNEHVAGNGAQVRLVTSGGLISAKVVKVDSANDLALLQAEGRFAALPVASSHTVRLGGMVATVGFPNIGLQGFAPKLAKGEIASLSGAQDDARYFQISVPVQPGNSGGALVSERGAVVGVVSAKLSARAALATSGQLPENVN